MKVGLHVPQAGRFARPEVIRAFAQDAEDAGFDSLWVFDHVVLQKEQQSKYPYSADGKIGIPPEIDFLEPMTLLTYLAAATNRVQLGTSVLVLPMRQPVLHAKMLASIDHLSGGRVILGGGVGWWKEEFAVLGVPFERRGARTDEWLRLARALWTEEWVDFRGEFYECVDWTSNPKPVNGDIPVWLGGESRRQMERIGRLANGWHATWTSVPTLKQDFAVAQEAAERAGRDPAELTLSVAYAAALRGEDDERVAESLGQLAEQGVDHAMISVHPRAVENAAEIIHAFGERYLPALRG